MFEWGKDHGCFHLVIYFEVAVSALWYIFTKPNTRCAVEFGVGFCVPDLIAAAYAVFSVWLAQHFSFFFFYFLLSVHPPSSFPFHPSLSLSL